MTEVSLEWSSPNETLKSYPYQQDSGTVQREGEEFKDQKSGSTAKEECHLNTKVVEIINISQLCLSTWDLKKTKLVNIIAWMGRR